MSDTERPAEPKLFQLWAETNVDVMAPPEALEDAYLKCMAGLVETRGVREGDRWEAQPTRMVKLEDGTFKRAVRVLLIRSKPTAADLQAMEPAPPPSEEPQLVEASAPNAEMARYEDELGKFVKRAVDHFKDLPPPKKAH